MKTIFSHIESTVSQFYMNHHIYQPIDMAIDDISAILDIQLTFNNGPSLIYTHATFISINIDPQLTQPKQRAAFFKGIAQTLCFTDLLTHHPFTPLIPNIYDHVNEFIQSLALPYHMLVSYDFADPLLPEQLSKDFDLPLLLCRKRMQVVQVIEFDKVDFPSFLEPT
ncbi:hypothetical protein [Tuberibacillus sp. Marseille-P3662]|uniref:hypothetical protein n=1 Tax=Tuberibacillus sp. Marseille-P3662 TaxID=1965358 RepID=UPI000A1CD448|nr:hypothetical protein [Tuberibacillus sp. Marseille-P3662]